MSQETSIRNRVEGDAGSGDVAGPEKPHMSADPTDAAGDPHGVLLNLISQAEGSLAAGEVVDSAWVRAASGYLARAISESDQERVVNAQEAFRRLAGAAR